MKLHISSTEPNGFYRCGRLFPAAGLIVDAAEFEPAQLGAIRSEVRLRVEEVSDDEAAGEDVRAIDSLATITATFLRLEPADFDDKGKPKLEALRKLLPDVKVTAALRDEAWAAANV